MGLMGPDPTAEAAESLIKELPLYFRAYELVKQHIAAGRIRPGQRLTDHDLAEYLGISRTPAREAVRLLVQDKLLTALPNRGVWVFTPTPEDLAEVYVLRSELEGLAAMMVACTEARGEVADRLERTLAEAREMASSGEAEKVVHLNTEFHGLLVAASGSSYLSGLVSALRVKAMVYRRLSLRQPGHTELSLQEHEAIVAILRQGKARETQELVRGHILAAGGRLLRVFHQESGKLDTSLPTIRLCLEATKG